MYLIPAIDLLGGRCVRLVQGEYHRYINYEDNPAKKAAEFMAEGAEWLHLIDLDGARVGKCVNIDSLRAIINKVKGLKIQAGGGIRDRDSIKIMLDMGVERVIIGTKAVSDADWLREMAAEFTGRIVLSLDVRGSKIATHGWKKDHPRQLQEMVTEFSKLPLAAIIYTDINKDGMLSGPNIERAKSLAESVSLPVIAAGGVTTVEDVEKLVQAKSIAAAIIGRALYEGTMKLSQAIAACQ